MWTVAWHAYRRFFDPKALGIIALFGVGIVLLAVDPEGNFIVDPQSVIEQGQMVAVALAVLFVIFLGGTEIPRDLKDRTILIYMSKPLGRRDYVIGKFLGPAMMGLTLLGCGQLLFAGLLAVRGRFVGWPYFEELIASGLAIVMLAAIAALAGARLPEMSAALFTALLAMAGTFSFLIPLFAAPLGPTPGALILWMLYYLLPNWHHLTFGRETAEITGYWLWMTLYALLFSSFYLFFACLTFTRRDIQ